MQPAFVKGTGNAYGFAACNALSFQMVLGSPMILYAKSLGASATTLGLIAGMLPLLVVLQIPAARFVDAAGYKRFVVTGWAVRTVFIVFIALVPLEMLPLADSVRLALLLGLLFFFNAVRGVFSCGWLPWIASLIPAALRGRYLATEAGVTNIASIAAFWLAALVIGEDAVPLRFSLLFAFSTVAGIASVAFLARIPAEPSTDAVPVGRRPGLGQMWRRVAFRRLLVMNVAWSLASGGALTFIVSFLKGMLDLQEQTILLITSVTFIGGVLNQFLLRSVLDRHGSKPVMAIAIVLWIAVMALWALVAGRLLHPGLGTLILLMFGVGLANSLVNLANVRLAMIVIPERGRSHYFAVYSVVGSVTLGLAPIAWGVLVDALHATATMVAGFEANRFSILFATLAGMFGLTLLSSLRLEEPEAENLDEIVGSVMGASRIRYWLRYWFRSTPRP